MTFRVFLIWSKLLTAIMVLSYVLRTWRNCLLQWMNLFWNNAWMVCFVIPFSWIIKISYILSSLIQSRMLLTILLWLMDWCWLILLVIEGRKWMFWFFEIFMNVGASEGLPKRCSIPQIFIIAWISFLLRRPFNCRATVSKILIAIIVCWLHPHFLLRKINKY